MDARLQHPFTALICGPTQSGKTQFVKRLLKERESMISPSPDNIIWCYGEYQPAYTELTTQIPAIRFAEGIPSDLNSMISPHQTNLLIIDDLMTETGNDKRITNLFTKGSHHRNLSVILILQNLFHQGRETRTISLNSHYLILFKNPRDGSQITHLAKQMYPGRTHFIQEAFADATREPYGYLLIDLKPNTPEVLRLRTNVFPGETPFVYVRKT